MHEQVEEASVHSAVAPRIRVGLGLEQREVEALHVALAAGVAQRLEGPGCYRSLHHRRIHRAILHTTHTVRDIYYRF